MSPSANLNFVAGRTEAVCPLRSQRSKVTVRFEHLQQEFSATSLYNTVRTQHTSAATSVRGTSRHIGKQIGRLRNDYGLLKVRHQKTPVFETPPPSTAHQLKLIWVQP